MLNQSQIAQCRQRIDAYLADQSSAELDRNRVGLIPTIAGLIADYRAGSLELPVFKTKIDSLNKQNQFWGFKGMSGQMFFNMMFNTSADHGLLDRFDQLLKWTIEKPSDSAAAKLAIDEFVTQAANLGQFFPDGRAAPRTGSVPFFLSYFWSMQDWQRWPIYYSSMVKSLIGAGISSFSGSPGANYLEFLAINEDLLSEYASTPNQVTLWDIEHAFFSNDEAPAAQARPVVPSPAVQDTRDGHQNGPDLSLPASYIPPIVSILPELARNADGMIKTCEHIGISVEKVFEQRVAVLFSIFGYSVEALGQGYGRVPDGIAIAPTNNYAIIYDAKVRKDGYALGTDDRAIKEYINSQIDQLRRRGMRHVYFAIITSAVNGDFDDFIRSIKMETDIRELVFFEIDALMALLELRLQSNEFDLGPRGMQSYFAQSGVVRLSDIGEYVGK